MGTLTVRKFGVSLDPQELVDFAEKMEYFQATFEELSAKGVEFIQPPSQRPYGTEALCRDNSGNWLVLVEPTV